MIGPFIGRYRWLSNFWIEPDGTCVEVEYQRTKTIDPIWRAKFDGVTPGQAKRLGKHVPIREDWDKVKLWVMEDWVYGKFAEHKYLRDLLIGTGDEEIIEVNTWGDRYWGMCNGVGENHLGKIIMKVREDVKELNA